MKKFLSLVLALVMVLSLGVTAGAVDFTDEAAITKEEAVGVLAGLGIINGYKAADGTYSFAPNGNITRGAAAKIICMIKLGTKVAGILSCETAPFKDVAKDSTFAPYIAYCANEGIVGGYADGTFKPGNPVTGYAFTKMLLNALGIKGDYEGLNYGVNVALAADDAGLFAGMDADTLYGNNCIREDACQLAFNALNYSASGAAEEYVVYVDLNENEKFDTADTKVWTGTDALTALVMKSSDEDYSLAQTSVKKDSLGYKNFDLTKITDGDDFGRDSVIYTNGKESDEAGYVKYASFANNAKASYTTATKLGTIASALGYKTEEDAAKLTLQVIEDGEEGTKYTDITKGDSRKVGGNGTLIEVYEDADEDTDDTFNVIIINTYVKQLAEDDIVEAVAATSTTDAEAAYIIIDAGDEDDEDDDLTFETAAFAEDDVVLYTVAAGKVQNVVKAAYVSGYVTATASDYIRVNGVQYKLSENNDDTVVVGDTVKNAIAGKADGYVYDADKTNYTYYLDNFGYVIKAIEGEAATVTNKYAYVIAAKSVYDEDEATASNLFETAKTAKAAAQVKVVDLATGEIVVKNVSIVKNTKGEYVYATTTGAASSDKVEEKALNTLVTAGRIYKYVEQADGSIVMNGTVAQGDVTVEKNVATVATNVYANSATKLTVIELESEDGEVVSASTKTVTGIANFPSTAKTYNASEEIGAQVMVQKSSTTNIASNIVVVIADEEDETPVNYAIYDAEGETDADGTKHNFYVGGAKVGYYVDEEVEGLSGKGNVFNITLTDDVVTAATPVASMSGTALLTVKSIDATYMVVEGADGKITVYFDEDGYAVFNKDDSYKVDTLAVGDKIKVYGGSVADAENGNTTWVDIALVVIDN